MPMEKPERFSATNPFALCEKSNPFGKKDIVKSQLYGFFMNCNNVFRSSFTRMNNMQYSDE